jgi:hypothetical protein
VALGIASRRIVGAIGFVSNMWVRASISMGRAPALLQASDGEGWRA